MRELIDCHIHTEVCGHATGTAAQMVSAAVFAGLHGIVMTEHLPLPEDLDPGRELSPPMCDLISYAEQVRELADRAKGLRVVLGAEADWLPGREDYARAVRAEAATLGVEVVLGSVHMMGDWTFDDPNDLSGWDTTGPDEAWERYFSLWCDAARSGAFDVMAHPDLVKKFGHRPSFDCRELYAEAASAAAEGGVLIEASTAGWRKPVAELYPGPDLLRAFAEAGVGATVGSDAHAPAEVGYRIADAYAELAEAGYTHVCLPLGGGNVERIEL